MQRNSPQIGFETRQDIFHAPSGPLRPAPDHDFTFPSVESDDDPHPSYGGRQILKEIRVDAFRTNRGRPDDDFGRSGGDGFPGGLHSPEAAPDAAFGQTANRPDRFGVRTPAEGRIEIYDRDFAEPVERAGETGHILPLENQLPSLLQLNGLAVHEIDRRNDHRTRTPFSRK